MARFNFNDEDLIGMHQYHIYMHEDFDSIDGDSLQDYILDNPFVDYDTYIEDEEVKHKPKHTLTEDMIRMIGNKFIFYDWRSCVSKLNEHVKRCFDVTYCTHKYNDKLIKHGVDANNFDDIDWEANPTPVYGDDNDFTRCDNIKEEYNINFNEDIGIIRPKLEDDE